MPTLKVRSSKIWHLLRLDRGEKYTRLDRPHRAASVATNRKPFTNATRSLFGRWQVNIKPTSLDKNPNDYVPDDFYKSRYTVYSYGEHFPMYIWDEDTERWYGNKDKYSVTTSKHQALARPRDTSTLTNPDLTRASFATNRPSHIVWLDTKMMISIDRYGVMATLIDKAGGNPFDTTQD